MSDLETFFAAAPATRLSAGEPVFHRGDPVKDAIFVASGEIALVRTLSEGETLTLHVARAGALLAEASLFAERYHCDAIAQADTTLRRVKRALLLNHLSEAPDLLLKLFAVSAAEVQSQRARVEILRMKRLSDRLDAWLNLQGPPDPGGWKSVAETIGVTPAALYRELARRRSDGRMT
ncbi:Crp/Fnr family transcriptional regulator [Roseivivax sp. THAF40]|uniref:Crp/Fnr family transcriptional regulator n=1 Tax=Roseivivax sp. THAF40 TaxID=2587858 RepID=UPI0015624AE8|nr:Crp/Fnr family transcriptional regulator [Roseivivax sp. THAF40]